MNLFILQLDKNTFEFTKWYFEEDDQKVIRDYSIDLIGNLQVIGKFWGSIIISKKDTIRNTNGRSYDGFYFKIDSNKNVWAKKGIGGSNDQFSKQLFLTNEGNLNIFGSFNAAHIEVYGIRILNNFNSYNIFILSLDDQSNILSLNQFNKETFILPNNFSHYSEIRNTYLSAGYFYGDLNIGNGRVLKNSNDMFDGFILLMDAQCGPIYGYQISGVNGESVSITKTGNGEYTFWDTPVVTQHIL